MQKILMTLMGLEIGGAETHVVELALELKRCGYDITVASNGGVYQEELEKGGVKHYHIPLHNKNPFNIIKSYFMLKKLIREEKYDIVHAHARIPAFICGQLQKRLGFKFMTTAHWVFRTTFPFRGLTNWGERTIAVSQDIKGYLQKNYCIPPEKIFVTINGIDTNKFSPTTRARDLEKELELERGMRRIVYVSRMDTDRSAVAFMLLDALEKLEEQDREKWSDLQAILVGGGNDLERLREAADGLNKRLRRRAAVVIGSRTDINRCIALGDVFVGVSRAALEAMASEKPTIIAGNEGYIGICNEENMPISIKTNFCCRGCPNSTADLLARDLETLFSGDLMAAGSFGRQIIIEKYSVKRMANDAISAYDALLSDGPSKRILISGYYGFKNMGDDSLLQAIIANLRAKKPNLDITVLSRAPGETRRRYCVKSVNRANPISVLWSMSRGGLLVNGGGSLLQDVTSTKSLLYYLTIMNVAKLFGMKSMIYANGIGPIKNGVNRRRVRQALQKVDRITLRDDYSKTELKKLKVNKEVDITADPAFALEAVGEERLRSIFLEEGLDFDTPYFLVSVRDCTNSCAEFADRIAQVLDYVEEKYGIHPLILPMQPRDKTISRRIARLSTCNPTLIKNEYSSGELLALVSKMKLVIGMRLHMLIYAATQAVPILGISYDPKIDAILYMLGQKLKYKASDLNAEAVKKGVVEIMKNHVRISKELAVARDKLRERTLKDVEIVMDLLGD